MVKVGDRVHVRAVGRGTVVAVDFKRFAPVLVRFDDKRQADRWEYQTSVVVIRPVPGEEP